MPNSQNLSSYRSVGLPGYPASRRWQTLCFVILRWNLGSFRQTRKQDRAASVQNKMASFRQSEIMSPICVELPGT
jgi:hypothetical protein